MSEALGDDAPPGEPGPTRSRPLVVPPLRLVGLGGGAATEAPVAAAVAVPAARHVAWNSPTSSVSSDEDADHYEVMPSASFNRTRTSQGGDKPMPMPKMPNAFEVESSQYSSRRSSEKRRLIQMIRAGSIKVQVSVKQWHRSCVVSVRWQLVLIFTVAIDLSLLFMRIVHAVDCAHSCSCPLYHAHDEVNGNCSSQSWTHASSTTAAPGETKGCAEFEAFFLEALRHFNSFWRRHPGWHVFWTLLVSVIYAADVIMRMRAVGARAFFGKALFVFDAIVAVFTVVGLLFLLRACWAEDCLRCQSDDASSPLLDIMRALRVVRFVQVVRLCPHVKVMRYSVSGSKRRFVDWLEDIDLDLTYVTRRTIAMSVPAVGFRRWFRNPMTEVARFFETFHPHRYLIVNCCPELPYDTTLFHSGKFVKFDIQDHMPPTLPQFVEFVRVVVEWMSQHPDNIVAVHCKGGKGRTGSLVTAWLLYTRDCITVDDALNTFALARTDITSRIMCAGAELQGVETPSQVRYLEQFDRLLMGTSGDSPLLDMPVQRDVIFSALTFHQIWRKPPPKSMQICVQKVLSGAKSYVIFWSDPFPGDMSTVSLDNLRCCGDLRVSVFDASLLEEARAKNQNGVAFAGDCVHPVGADGSLSPSHWGSTQSGPAEVSRDLGVDYTGKRCLAGQEPGCLFYFILHTAFLEAPAAAMAAAMVDRSMASGTLKVVIGSEDNHGGMDKAWKMSRKYHLDGHVALDFKK